MFQILLDKSKRNQERISPINPPVWPGGPGPPFFALRAGQDRARATKNLYLSMGKQIVACFSFVLKSSIQMWMYVPRFLLGATA